MESMEASPDTCGLVEENDFGSDACSAAHPKGILDVESTDYVDRTVLSWSSLSPTTEAESDQTESSAKQDGVGKDSVQHMSRTRAVVNDEEATKVSGSDSATTAADELQPVTQFNESVNATGYNGSMTIALKHKALHEADTSIQTALLGIDATTLTNGSAGLLSNKIEASLPRESGVAEETVSNDNPRFLASEGIATINDENGPNAPQIVHNPTRNAWSQMRSDFQTPASRQYNVQDSRVC